MSYIQMSDDERFIELLGEQIKISEQLIDLGKVGALSLKTQRFQQDANRKMISDQQKEITENKAAIEAAKNTARDIIELAKEEAKKIKNASMTVRAEANTLKEQAEKMKEEAEKLMWEAKKGVKV